MTMEKVMVLSGLKGAATPAADPLASLRQHLANLVALVKRYAAAAKASANAAAKATKAGDLVAAVAHTRNNAAASVLAHNTEAQAELIQAAITGYRRGQPEAAGALLAAHDMISGHSLNTVVPTFAQPAAPGAARASWSRGFGSGFGRLGSPQAVAVRTVSNTTDANGNLVEVPSATSYVYPGIIGIYKAGRAANKPLPYSGPYTLDHDEQTLYNQTLQTALAASFGPTGDSGAHAGLVRAGGAPFMQVDGNIWAFYDTNSGTLTIKDQGADGLAAVGVTVATVAQGIGSVAKDLINATCGVVGAAAPAVAIATGAPAASGACHRAATAPPLAQPTDYTPWIIGAGLLAVLAVAR